MMYNAGIRSGDILCGFDKFPVDNHGECKVDFNSEKVHIKDLLWRYNIGDSVDIKYWSKKKESMEIGKIIFQKSLFKIRNVYPTIENNPDFEIIGGLIIMNLRLNHILSLELSSIPPSKHRDLVRFTKSKNRFKNRLIITNILPGSYIKSINNLKPGDMIKSIGDKEINTLDEFRKEIINNIIKKKNKNYISFQTDASSILLIDIEKIIEEDKFLSSKYNYKFSETYTNLNDIKNGKFKKPYTVKYALKKCDKKNPKRLIF